MSPLNFDRHVSPQLPTDISADKRVYQKRWAKVAVHAFLLTSFSAAIIGCQSNPKLQASASNALIDFSQADAVQNNAQAQAFHTGLDSHNERYEQLFDETKNPSPELQAKRRLISAIRQHLAGEHVAVAQANYQARPYVATDSIDAGSSSLLKTLIELYAYKEASSDSDYEDYDSYEGYDYEEEAYSEDDIDDPDAVVVIEEGGFITDAHAAIEYDTDDYDSEGYDKNGYDWYGYNSDGYDEDGYDEEGYDIDGYDYYGYTRADNDYNAYSDEYNYDEYDYDDEEEGGALSILSALNPRALLGYYEAMQQAKQQDKDDGISSYPSGSKVSDLFNLFERTPEQVKAINAYQYKNLTFNSVSRYNPKQRQLQSVYSYDYLSPTVSSSIQIPLAFDFNKSQMQIDPSALMPLVAIINPEHTPLPDQMQAHTVNFGFPKAISSQVPSSVLYDAVIDALQESMNELGTEYFTPVDIRGDKFAQQVGASRAVKVYFGSQQSGEIIGKMLKHISQSLQTYVDAHPEKYADDTGLKGAIDKIQLYNQGYQSADIGALLQGIEAIAPFTFNQVNHYYLDSSDRLIAKQQQANFGSDLIGERITTINQIRYDSADFNQHRLTPLLKQSFGENAKPAIDGDAWLAAQRELEGRLEAAHSARYNYDNSDDDAEFEGSTEYDFDSDNGIDEENIF